jgi:hypothetical protein
MDKKRIRKRIFLMVFQILVGFLNSRSAVMVLLKAPRFFGGGGDGGDGRTS